MSLMRWRSAGSKRPTSTAAAHTLFTSASVRTCTTVPPLYQPSGLLV